MNSVEQNIWRIAEQMPDKLAVVSGKESATYKQLCCRILSAKEILLCSVKSGDTVVLSAGKQIEFVYVYFGAHLAGIKVVPIDPNTNPTRLQHILNETGAQLVIGFENTEQPNISLKEFSQLSERNFSTPLFPEADSIADILFTTGTTGQPKGVPLTFDNEAAAVRNINKYIGNTKDDVELLALPISHSFGLGRIRCCLSIGEAIVILGSFTNVKKLYRTMDEFHVTGFTMVPASWRYLNKFSGDKLQDFAEQLHYIEMGSAYFSAEEKEHLASLLPHTKICMHYGLTEATRSAFLEFHRDYLHLDSVGKPSPFTEIEIFDEGGSMLPFDAEGEICVKGDHVMKGYLNNKATDTFFKEYFRTGDWGYKDSEGYIYLKSRKKELINVGGKKVSPIEVENVLMTIKGISECACVGVPDPEGILGEVVKAFLVKEKESEVNITFEEMSSQLQGKLEAYKIPALYQWIEEIPKSQNGKILRFQLV